jgi:hypothetical protein
MIDLRIIATPYDFQSVGKCSQAVYLSTDFPPLVKTEPMPKQSGGTTYRKLSFATQSESGGHFVKRMLDQL